MEQVLMSDSLIGITLREAREAQKLTIEDVSKQLRLSEKQIHALEADEFEGFASAMLARGFIKNYARMLNLDPEPLLDAHRKFAPQDLVQSILYTSETAIPMPQASRSKLITFFLIGVLLVGGLFWIVFNNLNHQENPDQAEITLDHIANQTPEPADISAAAMPEQALPAAERNEIAEESTNKQPVSAFKSPENLPTTNVEIKSSNEEKSTTENSTKIDPLAPAPIIGGLKVTFKFTDESWISVQDKNYKSVLSKLGRAGDVEEVEGLPPLRIVIGNANGTQLILKNKNIDLMPYNKSNVVHMTLPME